MSDTDNILNGDEPKPYPGTISSSLLGGIKDSQEDAWRRMSLLYAPLIYLWCRQKHLQPSDAEDVVQEVLRTVVLRVAEFERTRAEGSFRGWLRTITRHKVGDFIRATQRRSQVSADITLFEPIAAPSEPPEEAAGDTIAAETRLIFNRVLELVRAGFEERTWQAFLRVVMDGVAPQDAADELGMSVESVYQAKSRILRRVRDELRELGK